MSVKFFGNSGIVFGVPVGEVHLTNAPTGARIRFRFRNDDFARVYIKTSDGISEYILCQVGNVYYLNPKMRQGKNERRWTKESDKMIVRAANPDQVKQVMALPTPGSTP
jgi:hypothetical protein